MSPEDFSSVFDNIIIIVIGGGIAGFRSVSHVLIDVRMIAF